MMGRARMVVIRHNLVGLIDRHVRERGAVPTQKIDQFVAGDSVHSRRQGLLGIVGMPFDMDRQYSFLNQIFSLRCTSAESRELGLVIATQAAAQPIEERTVRCAVTLEARQHQTLEFDFESRHACHLVNSSVRRIWLQSTAIETKRIADHVASVQAWPDRCAIFRGAALIRQALKSVASA
jgi:hypothetical protein